jgi:hypothetical protein
MKEPKTQPTDHSVKTFLNNIDDPQKRADSFAVMHMMEIITGEPAKMWGTGIVGFGTYHYKYESGREGDAGLIGFAPRKNALTIYIVNGYDNYGPLLKKLGKHTTGKVCLYIKKLSDIDLEILRELMNASVTHMKAEYK